MHNLVRFHGSIGYALLAGALLGLNTSASHASMITLAFENTGNAQLVIDRADSGGGVGTFSFRNSTIDPGNGNDFLITTLGDAALLYGNIDGVFTIGTITDNGLTPGTPGYTQVASVSGVGAFAIHDGLGYDLSGAISFSTISTGAGPGLSLGTVSSGGGVAISGLTYGGANPLLQELASIGDASMIISFMFDNASLSLQSLTAGAGAGGTTLASYVGALSALSPDLPPNDPPGNDGPAEVVTAAAGPNDRVINNPEPSSMVLLGMGMLTCCAGPVFRRRRTAVSQS